MAGKYPKEFREDVIRVARDRGPGETLEQIANDFGVHPVTLSKWLRQTDIDDGRAAAYLSQANLPGKGSTRS